MKFNRLNQGRTAERKLHMSVVVPVVPVVPVPVPVVPAEPPLKD